MKSYSAGRVSGWLVEPFFIFLVLAFPSGRLVTRAGRVLVAASLLLVALFYLPTMLLVESYPTPSPWTSCGADCPANAFMLVGSEPGFVDARPMEYADVTFVPDAQGSRQRRLLVDRTIALRNLRPP